jgi:hypothetical protein
MAWKIVEEEEGVRSIRIMTLIFSHNISWKSSFGQLASRLEKLRKKLTTKCLMTILNVEIESEMLIIVLLMIFVILFKLGRVDCQKIFVKNVLI